MMIDCQHDIKTKSTMIEYTHDTKIKYHIMRELPMTPEPSYSNDRMYPSHQNQNYNDSRNPQHPNQRCNDGMYKTQNL